MTLIMKPRVFPSGEGSLHDTFLSCRYKPFSAYKYAHGDAPANHLVPVTIDNAYTARAHHHLAQCPFTDGPCAICIDKFRDVVVPRRLTCMG